MPATVRSEFTLALNQVATERGIDPTVVLDGIKAAILAAYRKDNNIEEIEEYEVILNPENGEARIEHDGKDVTPPGFGRIAAQTAKQVILQRVREAEKQTVLSDFQTKVGTILSGMVLRFDGQNVIVDIGRAQAVMPPQEQSQSERYNLNQRLMIYIEGIHETPRGSEIIVSRAHKGLVEGLFRREVPEVAQGSVEIRAIAREAGRRTKVAVFSSQPGVDPVGSCVGQKGVRVQAVINELGGHEKVDIIQWSDDPVQFIIASLAPATDLVVKIQASTKSAIVTVPEDQLSLAIGRDGQNVRLAAKLTLWKIDIRGKVDGKEKILTELPDTSKSILDNSDLETNKTIETESTKTDQNSTLEKKSKTKPQQSLVESIVPKPVISNSIKDESASPESDITKVKE